MGSPEGSYSLLSPLYPPFSFFSLILSCQKKKIKESGVPIAAQGVQNPALCWEDVGSIPGITRGLRIRLYCKLLCGLQKQLGSGAGVV